MIYCVPKLGCWQLPIQCRKLLLLKRVFEIEYLKSKSIMEPLEEINKSKIIRLKIRLFTEMLTCKLKVSYTFL
jgi:hypothetical protein